MANTIPQNGFPNLQPPSSPPAQSPTQSQAAPRAQVSPGSGQGPERQPSREQDDAGGRPQTGLVDRLAQTADQTAARAVERVQSTRDQARAGVEKQQAEIGTRIRGLSEALRSSGDNLEDNEAASRLLGAASDQIERLASYVDEASARSIASDLHGFARDRPAWFFGAAFLGGLALGRFVKSSARMAAEGGDDERPRRGAGAERGSYRAPISRSTNTGHGSSNTGYGSASTTPPRTRPDSSVSAGSQDGREGGLGASRIPGRP